MWNSLPKVVVSATNIQLLKLDKHWSIIGYGYVQLILFYGFILFLSINYYIKSSDRVFAGAQH